MSTEAMSNPRAGFHTDVREWAKAVFGKCNLGDVRRTARAVAVAALMAANPSASPKEACEGDEAAMEGFYRFLRNDKIRAEDLDEGPFRHTAELCRDHATILAIQDTTDLVFSHSVRHQLGDLGGGRGLVVHSVLAVDAETREVIGLLDQKRWIRPDVRPGKRQRKKRPYKEKESYKWEQASQNIRDRLHKDVAVIEVADREADIYEYLKNCSSGNGNRRYVVRAFQPRKLVTGNETVKQHMEKQPVLGMYEVRIGQRGPMTGKFNRTGRAGRCARTVQMEIRFATVELKAPKRIGDSSLTTNVVYVREQGAQENPLEWLLLTSEPVSTAEEAKKIIGYYETRWLVEEFHKAWKSGCKIEASRLQSPDNLERFAVVTSHIAIRLLQLRFLAQKTPKVSCDMVLGKDEWQCLFATTNPKKALPDSAPSLHWAVQTIAKLGGWIDTKRTGRIGWATMWKGWFRFQERVIAWRAATSARG